MKIPPIVFVMLFYLLPVSAYADAQKVTVLELFTSQGCSSCPPADDLLRQISSQDASVLPLSFHVDYWNYLGWKDPFSSPLYTDRQKNYARLLGENRVYTPELVIDGMQSMVGSQELKVRLSLAQAKARMPDVAVNMAAALDASQLIVEVNASHNLHPDGIEIWEVHYTRSANTAVSTGENSGHRLNNINNVTALISLGILQNANATYKIPKPSSPNEGVAVIAQLKNQGLILNAAYYSPPSS